ncbi:hypothetical protein H4582DRAFT_1334243 [Lactarius indigo]|nr:hypothetical protein H4582DRAFT_1334243 [Lactarius indigo]
MYVHRLEDFRISQLLPRGARSRSIQTEDPIDANTRSANGPTARTTFARFFSPLKMQRPPQPQLRRTWACSLFWPTSLTPFCCRIGRGLQLARATLEATRRLHLRRYVTAQRCRGSERRWQASCGGTWSTSPARWQRTTGYFASHRRGENGCEPGRDEAGAHVHAGSLRKGTRGDVSDNDERRRRRDCVFGHVFCHPVHMRGDGRRPLASQGNNYISLPLCVSVKFIARQTHVTWWQSFDTMPVTDRRTELLACPQ